MTIKFTSRASIKIKDNFYTFEACIERSLPDDISESDYIDAKQKLWDEVTNEVDEQIIETSEFLKNKNPR